MSASETGLLPEPDECPFCGAPSHAALLAEVEDLRRLLGEAYTRLRSYGEVI